MSIYEDIKAMFDALPTHYEPEIRIMLPLRTLEQVAKAATDPRYIGARLEMGYVAYASLRERAASIGSPGLTCNPLDGLRGMPIDIVEDIEPYRWRVVNPHIGTVHGEGSEPE